VANGIAFVNIVTSRQKTYQNVQRWLIPLPLLVLQAFHCSHECTLPK